MQHITLVKDAFSSDGILPQEDLIERDTGPEIPRKERNPHDPEHKKQ